jgi:thioredoxin 1
MMGAPTGARVRNNWQGLFLLTVMLLVSCGEGDRQAAGRAETAQANPSLHSIQDEDEFNRIIASAGDRLVLLDVYADWCLPCKELEPILESIARNSRHGADIYKINLDENPYLFDLFQVRGIPLVVFVRNQTVVYSLMGLRSKETYLEAIRSFSRS